MQPPALVIAIGNPLRRDDGAAWAVADLLEERLPPAAADIRRQIQLTPELAEAVGQARVLIVIDASETLPAGQTAVRSPDETAEPPTLTHHVSPAALTAYAAALYGHAPPAHLLTIGGADFGFGEGLSSAVQAAVPVAAALAAQIVGA